MQRFFVEPHQIEEAKHHIHINGTDVNHIKNVLRMKCGEDVWISDGGEKEYHCRIEELGDDEVLLSYPLCTGAEVWNCRIKSICFRDCRKQTRWN